MSPEKCYLHCRQVRELCPFDLAPVTSTAIQMLFGDTVAIALMQVHTAAKDDVQALVPESYPAGQLVSNCLLTCCGHSCSSLLVSHLNNCKLVA